MKESAAVVFDRSHARSVTSVGMCIVASLKNTGESPIEYFARILDLRDLLWSLKEEEDGTDEFSQARREVFRQCHCQKQLLRDYRYIQTHS